MKRVNNINIARATGPVGGLISLHKNSRRCIDLCQHSMPYMMVPLFIWRVNIGVDDIFVIGCRL